jgi:hypothetical protein
MSSKKRAKVQSLLYKTENSLKRAGIKEKECHFIAISSPEAVSERVTV